MGILRRRQETKHGVIARVCRRATRPPRQTRRRVAHHMVPKNGITVGFFACCSIVTVSSEQQQHEALSDVKLRT